MAKEHINHFPFIALAFISFTLLLIGGFSFILAPTNTVEQTTNQQLTQKTNLEEIPEQIIEAAQQALDLGTTAAAVAKPDYISSGEDKLRCPPLLEIQNRMECTDTQCYVPDVSASRGLDSFSYQDLLIRAENYEEGNPESGTICPLENGRFVCRNLWTHQQAYKPDGSIKTTYKTLMTVEISFDRQVLGTGCLHTYEEVG